MEKLIIYNKDGEIKLITPSNGAYVTSCVHDIYYMQSDTVNVVLQSKSVLDIIPGDYIAIEGVRYRVNQMPSVYRTGENNMLEYNITFESTKYDLANVIFQLPDDCIGDYIVGNLADVLKIIRDNANRVYPGQWQISDNLPRTDICNLQFNDGNCLNALQKLVEYYKLQFRISTNDGVNTINVYEDGANSGIALSYGYSGGLYTIKREATSSENIITRLYVYGSSDNLPTGYRHSRLCISGKNRQTSYIQEADKINRYGIKEGLINLNDIKPSAKFSVNAIVDYKTIVCDALNISQEYGFKIDADWGVADYQDWLTVRGYTDSLETHTYYNNVVLGSYKYLTQGSATITFNTGNMAGRSVNIKSGGVSQDGDTIELIPYKENEGDIQLEQEFPSNGGAFAIAVGDEFVISNIELPYKLVSKAENELLAKAYEEYGKLSAINARYSVTFDSIYAKNANISALVPGDYVTINDNKLGVGKLIKIIRISKDLINGSVLMDISDIHKKEISNVVSGDVDADIEIEVGASSTLDCDIQANYDNNVNKIHTSANARFVSTELEKGKKRIWTMSETIYDVRDGRASYDIYLVCQKKGNYAALTFRPSRTLEVIDLEGKSAKPFARAKSSGTVDNTCYYVKIGTLSQVIVPKFDEILHGSGVPYRTLNLKMGNAIVDTTEIKGGLISKDVRINLDGGIGNLSTNVRNGAKAWSHHGDQDDLANAYYDVFGRLHDRLHDWFKRIKTKDSSFPDLYLYDGEPKEGESMPLIDPPTGKDWSYIAGCNDGICKEETISKLKDQ